MKGRCRGWRIVPARGNSKGKGLVMAGLGYRLPVQKVAAVPSAELGGQEREMMSQSQRMEGSF